MRAKTILGATTLPGVVRSPDLAARPVPVQSFTAETEAPRWDNDVRYGLEDCTRIKHVMSYTGE